jgi:hypothetical protein
MLVLEGAFDSCFSTLSSAWQAESSWVDHRSASETHSILSSIQNTWGMSRVCFSVDDDSRGTGRCARERC